ncbi:expressed unknown protein [Seminavis robusta]|uniref:Uncharacterized protein n=1 Tax=Seminavis robusta TaxID=568900 RepID=A0A9N8H837_9STRA|nr:expressed unknown protein [Seminavis robusta]|eukprot:Sro225_g091880.1 n/a (330) ;mRNA; f:73086-74075
MQVSQKCTNDFHGLIDEQELDWSRKRTLPDFQVRNDDKGGGVIVFWHVAKTGGTTVRKQCASLPGVDYAMLLTPEDYKAGSLMIADRLTPSWNTELDAFNHSRSHTLFVELHGMHSLTVLEMESRLRHWRDLSQKHGTPLFVFTLLREPTEYSLSFFNFFHDQKLEGGPTQLELQRASFNRQCRTLAAYPTHNKRVCALLYRKLHQLFDWVGTTERLTEETLPLLQHLLRFKPAQQRFAAESSFLGPSTAKHNFLLPSSDKRNKYNVAVPDINTLERDALTQETVRVLGEKTCLDRGLWERAQQDYTLDMWDDIIDGRPSSEDTGYEGL